MATSERVAIVTGASSGIGRASAVMLAKEGCKVTATGRNLEALQATKADCLKAGSADDKILLVTADVTKFDDLQRIVDETIAKFGRLDVLVNNAGIVVLGGILDITPEDYDKQMNTNLRSAVFLSKFAAPHLIKSKGVIVNISSDSATRASDNAVLYNLSKAGMDLLTKSCAMDLAKYGVRVNSVNPGLTKTAIFRRCGLDENAVEKQAKSNIPLGRMAEPEEMASIVCFLASSASSYITGTHILADAGTGAGQTDCDPPAV